MTTTPTKAAARPGGLTKTEADKLLKELEADPTTAAKARPLSPRERVIGSLLRERDHLDGCPLADDPKAAASRVEAYEERTPAPGPQLRNAGAVPGSAIVVVRCMGCAGMRYFVSEAPALTPTGEGRHVSHLIKTTLSGDADGDLDQSL